VVALVLGHVLTKGIGTFGEKEKALELAFALAQCKTHEQYLALLSTHYPGESRIWKSPALTASEQATSPSAELRITRTGQLKVVVHSIGPAQMLDTGSYVYLPAALVDDRGHGYRLEDIRLNSRQTDLVFEYYYAGVPELASDPARRFQFFLGRWTWTLVPTSP
jgi:hypothetical protein